VVVAAGEAAGEAAAGPGRCAMPCGAPCDLLPCDRRCDLPLACGHRCPSPCGEACPPPAFCAVCGSRFAELADEVVDLVMMTRLGEVDLDADPLIVLGCGHVFLMSTLDGWMELSSAYARDETTGAWTEPRLLPPGTSALRGCPTCRRQAPEVRRYGRPRAKARLDAAVDGHIRLIRGRVNDLLRRLDVGVEVASQAEARLDGSRRTEADDRGGCADCGVTAATAALATLAGAARALARDAEAANPATRVHAASLVTVTREEQAAAAAASPTVPPPSPGAVAAAARRRAAIALPPPDLGAPADAWMVAADAAVAASRVAGASRGGGAGSRRSGAGCGHAHGPQTAADCRAAAAVHLDAAGAALTAAADVATRGRLPARAVQVAQRRVVLLERWVEVDLRAAAATPVADQEAAVARQEQSCDRLQAALADLRATLTAWPSASASAFVATAARRAAALRARVRGEAAPGVLSVAEKGAIFAALHMTPADVAGHMFRCPAGDAYLVGDCGATNQVGTCPECRAPIGGSYAGPERGNERDPNYMAGPSRHGGA